MKYHGQLFCTEGSAYAGSKKITYKIVGQKINKASVDGITAKTYTGNESDVLVSLVRYLGHRYFAEHYFLADCHIYSARAAVII